jgi:CRP-like cAMP-binding protein
MKIGRSPTAVRRRSVGDVLIQTLSSARPLSAEARRVVRALPFTLENHRKQGVIAEAGRRADHLIMILDGYAARVKLTRRGEQPVVGFLLPGDVFDWPQLALGAAGGPTRDTPLDHSVLAVTAGSVALLRAPPLVRAAEEWPEIRHALDATALVERNVTREWLANISGRPASMRVAHVLCEHFWRMQMRGLAEEDQCPLPFNQARLSASQGLSVVHTNRVLKRLHAEGLVEVQGRTLRILDHRRLQAFADFSPGYLSSSGAAAPVGARW